MVPHRYTTSFQVGHADGGLLGKGSGKMGNGFGSNAEVC